MGVRSTNKVSQGPRAESLNTYFHNGHLSQFYNSQFRASRHNEPSAGMFAATGGTIDESSRTGWTLHKFFSTGPQSFDVSAGNKLCEILLVGGGGGAGSGAGGGGGGGGGVLYWNAMPFTSGAYAVGVGTAGISPGPGSLAGRQGGSSTISNGGVDYTADGGGWGLQGGTSATPGGPGGSGGGSNGSPGGAGGPGGTTTQTPEGSATGYGNAGGKGYHSGGHFVNGGGGGGAGAAGADSGSGNYPQPTYCHGGAGVQISITGSALYWSGGGGGSGHYNGSTAGNGGIGGGGGGAGNNNNGTGGGSALNSGQNGSARIGNYNGGDGGENTGGGGGANGGTGDPGARSGNGGTGCVIIAYQPD